MNGERRGTQRVTERVTATRTYLAMESPSELRAATPPPVALDVRESRQCTVAEYRRLYREVGAAWQWHDRDAWSDEQLAAHLARPDVHVWLARLGRMVAGFFELEERKEGAVEIVYFGLVARFIGRGLGGALLTRAVEEAWRLGARRVTLNTCTLDAPQALPNYLARGFTIEREEMYAATVVRN